MYPFHNENGNKLYFEDVNLSGESASIKTNRWTLNIKCDNDGFGFSDELGKPVAVQKDHEMQKLYF